MLAAEKDLKFVYEFFTNKKLLVIYRFVKKRKSKGEKSTSDPDVTISAPAPPTDVTIGPAIAALTQKVQDLKAQLAKHGDTLVFVEKVSLDLWSKFKVLFSTAFAPYQTGVVTPVLGNVVMSVVIA